MWEYQTTKSIDLEKMDVMKEKNERCYEMP